MRIHWGKGRVGAVDQSFSLISQHCHNSHHCDLQQADWMARTTAKPLPEKCEGCIPSVDKSTVKFIQDTGHNSPRAVSMNFCELKRDEGKKRYI
jgi:hypothetical protein